MILGVVANIQMRTLKTEVEKGSMWTTGNSRATQRLRRMPPYPSTSGGLSHWTDQPHKGVEYFYMADPANSYQQHFPTIGFTCLGAGSRKL